MLILSLATKTIDQVNSRCRALIHLHNSRSANCLQRSTAAISMAYLATKSAVMDTVYNLAYAIDDLDRAAIVSLFRQDVPFAMDISAVLGVPGKEISADEYYQLARDGLGGFDATQHLLGCPLVTWSGASSAHVKVYVVAFHAMEKDGGLRSVTARVTWNFDLELHEGHWLIRKFVIGLAAPLDNPELMHEAHQRAGTGFVRSSKESR